MNLGFLYKKTKKRVCQNTLAFNFYKKTKEVVSKPSHSKKITKP